MFKVLIGLGIGLVVGMCALPVALVIGARHVGETAQTAFVDSAVSALDEAYKGKIIGDDLETYRACIQQAYKGNASDAVAACHFEYGEWMYSPTFDAEWNQLMTSDSELAAIMRQFDVENGVDSVN